MTMTPNLSSNYFELKVVSDGVYAAIAKRGTGAVGNAGIIDLGEETVVFDTMYTPQAAQELRRAAEQLWGRPVSYVINSHFHFDHVGGNQAFARSSPRRRHGS